MDEKELQYFLIVFSAIAFFLALTLIVLFAVFQNRKNRLLNEQQEAENRFKEEIIEAQIEIKEDTLRNVSWELHDNIGQLLTLSKIQMQNARDNPDAIDEAISTIGQSLNELRSLSKLINPDSLTNLTLVEALQMEIERFNRLRYLEASGEYSVNYFEIDSKIELIIFRMLQEFFTNTVKHSKATRLKVNVEYRHTTLKIDAEDNGVGFDSSKMSTFKGIGLSNIYNRAKLINARVSVNSKVGQGTQFSLVYKI